MNRDWFKSGIIGAILGLTISVLQIDIWAIGLFLAIGSCLIAGLVTVIIVKNRPNLYALPATLASFPFLVVAYGLVNGSMYLLGVVLIYGMLSVQFFQAIFVATDNFKFIHERLGRRS